MKARRKSFNADHAFVMSDHADWEGLNQVIRESQAESIFVMHGYTETYNQWLNEKGYNSCKVEDLKYE